MRDSLGRSFLQSPRTGRSMQSGAFYSQGPSWRTLTCQDLHCTAPLLCATTAQPCSSPLPGEGLAKGDCSCSKPPTSPGQQEEGGGRESLQDEHPSQMQVPTEERSQGQGKNQKLVFRRCHSAFLFPHFHHRQCHRQIFISSAARSEEGH